MNAWMTGRLWLAASMVQAGAAALAQQAPAQVQAQAVAAAQAAASAQLQRDVRLAVESARVIGPWAFVSAQMRSAQGQPFDFAGTRWDEPAKHGAVSHRYVALLKLDQGTWQKIDERVGPTDVAWEGWAAKYGAPAALFELP